MENAVTWECRPRTKIKLEILNKYLGAWFAILAKHGFQHAVYIDTFCGPGCYSTGEDGSPILALVKGRSAWTASRKEFKPVFHFLDKDKNALENLVSLKTFKDAARVFPSSIHVYNGEFIGSSATIISRSNIGVSTPVFSFVDPFGFGASPFREIKKLMPNKHSEMFINFFGGWANRFINHPNEKTANNITELLGGEFVERVMAAEDKPEEVYQIYEEQLRNIAPFVKRFQLYDETNVRDNALYFVGHHIRGFIKMKEAMWSIDPINGRNFSEYRQTTTGGAPGLFDDQPNTALLGRQIIEQYSGKNKVKSQDILAWVEESTDFLTKHARRELEIAFNKNLLTFVYPNRKRRKNTWPSGIFIDFK